MENVKRQMEDIYSIPCHMFNVGIMLPYMEYIPKTLNEIIDGYNNYNVKTVIK